MTFNITPKKWRIIVAIGLLAITQAIALWVSPAALIAIAPEIWFLITTLR